MNVASNDVPPEPPRHGLDSPVVDTAMLVTLDQLQPYDLNPRVTRNPKYDEIKLSIRQRGLDVPPSITRRPGEPCFRIRSGGNTRLSILRELWSETKNEQFFHLSCLFRPWPKRGEIVALTGHLAENELRGGLTFIERALGVEKARELYELESGNVLSQAELSRRLTADGYPVQQSHISRMRDAIEHLLPAIPNRLYGGLGRHQVERLAVMRRSLAKTWETYAPTVKPGMDFPSLFHETLLTFDCATSDFNIARVQDELIGQMSVWLCVDYDTLLLVSEAGEKRDHMLMATPQYQPISKQSPTALPALGQMPAYTGRPDGLVSNNNVDQRPPAASEDKTTGRLQSIQALVARHTGDEPSSVEDALPSAQGSLFPISDIWTIDPGLNEPKRLRIHISQFAREICQDVARIDVIADVDEGIGFRCIGVGSSDHPFSSNLFNLLDMLTMGSPSAPVPLDIAPLLLGTHSDRLSDSSLVKLFRLIRLARRLIDLRSEGNPSPVMYSKEDP